MSSASAGKRNAAYDALFRAHAEVRALVDSTEFGLMALIVLFVQFTKAIDWREWTDRKDAITEELLDHLQDELGPGIVPTLGTLLSLPPAMHTDLIEAIDQTVKQLGYEEAFQLIFEEFTWDRGVFTPTSVAEVLADIVDADSATSVYDPFCRAGELLVAAGTRASCDSAQATVPIWGEVPSLKSQAIARMNLRLHELDGSVEQPESVHIAGLPKASVILTNPPFNVKSWIPHRDHEWRYGPPPEKNANFAWLQYVLERLEPGGKAAVLMANNASFSANERERRIRERMVLDGCVQALISLPPSLFHGTGVSTTIWLLKAPVIDSNNWNQGVVFVDASKAGHMASRTLRELDDSEIQEIVEAATGHTTKQPVGGAVRCTTASLVEIQDRNYNLSPAVYLPGSQSDAASSTNDLISRWESELTAAQHSDTLVRGVVASLARTQARIEATPTSWRKVRLMDVCELIPGAPTKDVPSGLGTIPVLKPKNLVSGRVVGKTDMVDASEASKNSRYRVENGDILCARTGTMGRVGLVTEEQRGWVFGSGLICIRVKLDSELDPNFLAAYFMSPAVVDWIIRNSGGTSIPSISVKVLGTLPTNLPPLHVQRVIAEMIDNFTKNAAAHQRAYKAATELRDSLLPGFFGKTSS